MSEVCVSDSDPKSRRRGCSDVIDEFGVPPTTIAARNSESALLVCASALVANDLASQAPYSGSGSVYDEVRREETPLLPGLIIALGSKVAEDRFCSASLVLGARKRRSRLVNESSLAAHVRSSTPELSASSRRTVLVRKQIMDLLCGAGKKGNLSVLRAFLLRGSPDPSSSTCVLPGPRFRVRWRTRNSASREIPSTVMIATTIPTMVPAGMAVRMCGNNAAAVGPLVLPRAG